MKNMPHCETQWRGPLLTLRGKSLLLLTVVLLQALRFSHYEWMNGLFNEWMNEWMNGLFNEWMNEWMIYLSLKHEYFCNEIQIFQQIYPHSLGAVSKKSSEPLSARQRYSPLWTVVTVSCQYPWNSNQDGC